MSHMSLMSLMSRKHVFRDMFKAFNYPNMSP